MKGHHGHNLRSDPHSKRTVRANSRAVSKTRAESQQHHGSETSGPSIQTPSGHAGDGPAPTTNSMHVIAAQQQQMKIVQEMMSAMQQQMVTMQHTIILLSHELINLCAEGCYNS